MIIDISDVWSQLHDLFKVKPQAVDLVVDLGTSEPTNRASIRIASSRVNLSSLSLSVMFWHSPQTLTTEALMSQLKRGRFHFLDRRRRQRAQTARDYGLVETDDDSHRFALLCHNLRHWHRHIASVLPAPACSWWHWLGGVHVTSWLLSNRVEASGDALKRIGTHGIADQEVGDIALLVEPS